MNPFSFLTTNVGQSPILNYIFDCLRCVAGAADIMESSFSTAERLTNKRAGNLDPVAFGLMVMIAHNSDRIDKSMEEDPSFWSC